MFTVRELAKPNKILYWLFMFRNFALGEVSGKGLAIFDITPTHILYRAKL